MTETDSPGDILAVVHNLYYDDMDFTFYKNGLYRGSRNWKPDEYSSWELRGNTFWYNHSLNEVPDLEINNYWNRTGGGEEQLLVKQLVEAVLLDEVNKVEDRNDNH